MGVLVNSGLRTISSNSVRSSCSTLTDWSSNRTLAKPEKLKQAMNQVADWSSKQCGNKPAMLAT